ncbi:MAG: folylpolyglutamate synthase/dihydrofolate synthase family protein [Pseudomonadota bacterium]
MRQATGSDAILDRLLALHPKLIDLTLDRVWRLLAVLDHPEQKLPPVVHIAGTNGKGSTLAMIRAGLESTGSSVHAYTSPHLVRFHERIRLAGTLIAEPDLAALLAECKRANGEAPITFFEITTVAALLAFSRMPADHLLLEVGLGGRLDATNVIAQPALTVITPVDLDHQQYLGETLAEIAGEKAGILKPGVPCVVARQSDQAREVIEARAAEVGAPLLINGQDWVVRMEHGRLVYQDERGLLDLDLPRLPGPHQIENAGAAIAALRVLSASDSACQAALTNVNWPARLQRLTAGALLEALPEGAELWIDGGHNPAAGEALAAQLDEWHASGGHPVHLIVGMLDTKAASDYLRPLAPRVRSIQTVTIPDAPASILAADLARMAGDAGAPADQAESVSDAIHDLAAETAPMRIMICGSLYLAGHVLGLNGHGMPN